jgi:hypothetical protein
MKTQKFDLNQLQWILAGVLVVQILLAVVVNLPKSTQASSGPLLEGYNPGRSVEILIENQTGDQIHIKKIDGLWVLPQKGNFPVEGDKVTELLGKLEKVKTNRMVTQTAASHSQLQVAEDDFMSKINLKEADGKSHRLFLGSSGGAGASHIRLSGHNQVYLTASLYSWEVSPSLSSWIDTQYLTLSPDEIQSLSVQNANGIFKFTKGTDGQWIYDGLGEGEIFDTDGFQTTVGRLASLRMVEPLGTEAAASLGFEEPGAAVVLELRDGTQSTSQLTLTIGGMLEANYAAKASSSPYYVKITPVYASSLLEMDHAGLLVAEPTPTPSP